nr:unnamed protein product [Haemonchus contortus]
MLTCCDQKEVQARFAPSLWLSSQFTPISIVSKSERRNSTNYTVSILTKPIMLWFSIRKVGRSIWLVVRIWHLFRRLEEIWTFPNLAARKRLDFIFTKRRIAKLFVYTIQNSFCFDLSFISERFPLLSL